MSIFAIVPPDCGVLSRLRLILIEERIRAQPPIDAHDKERAPMYFKGIYGSALPS
jgi:hypothetical protein